MTLEAAQREAFGEIYGRSEQVKAHVDGRRLRLLGAYANRHER
jgi:hypothetical protein